jgi:hypothetical protein
MPTNIHATDSLATYTLSLGHEVQKGYQVVLLTHFDLRKVDKPPNYVTLGL